MGGRLPIVYKRLQRWSVKIANCKHDPKFCLDLMSCLSKTEARVWFFHNVSSFSAYSAVKKNCYTLQGYTSIRGQLFPFCLPMQLDVHQHIPGVLCKLSVAKRHITWVGRGSSGTPEDNHIFYVIYCITRTHAMQENLHRGNREETGGLLPRTPTRRRTKQHKCVQTSRAPF